MKNDSKYSKVFLALNNYLVFFLLVAFVITCCTMLFVTVLTRTLDISLDSEDLGTAAKLTFANVVFLSAMFTLFDSVRRKRTVDRPVEKIRQAAQKIIEGDFTARVPHMNPVVDLSYKFNDIADSFNKMAEELSGTETLRTDFIANVSHELKTPLAVMQNYGTLLQQPDLPEVKRIEYAKAISESSRRLADLITNILKLNKLENQQIFPTARIYDLGEQLCECLLYFEDAWEKKKMEIDTDIEDGIYVKSDPEMMSLVWNNLFSNAIKFTENGGKVSLRVFSEGGYAIVQIADTGCGISKDVGAHIFDKFYQGDTSHSTQGNGLGLALVKRVVDITNSDISVESEVGKGTVFTVRMRRVSNAAQQGNIE